MPQHEPRTTPLIPDDGTLPLLKRGQTPVRGVAYRGELDPEPVRSGPEDFSSPQQQGQQQQSQIYDSYSDVEGLRYRTDGIPWGEFANQYGYNDLLEDDQKVLRNHYRNFNIQSITDGENTNLNRTRQGFDAYLPQWQMGQDALAGNGINNQEFQDRPDFYPLAFGKAITSGFLTSYTDTVSGAGSILRNFDNDNALFQGAEQFGADASKGIRESLSSGRDGFGIDVGQGIGQILGLALGGIGITLPVKLGVKIAGKRGAKKLAKGIRAKGGTVSAAQQATAATRLATAASKTQRIKTVQRTLQTMGVGGSGISVQMSELMNEYYDSELSANRDGEIPAADLAKFTLASTLLGALDSIIPGKLANQKTLKKIMEAFDGDKALLRAAKGGGVEFTTELLQKLGSNATLNSVLTDEQRDVLDGALYEGTVGGTVGALLGLAFGRRGRPAANTGEEGAQPGGTAPPGATPPGGTAPPGATPPGGTPGGTPGDPALTGEVISPAPGGTPGGTPGAPRPPIDGEVVDPLDPLGTGSLDQRSAIQQDLQDEIDEGDRQIEQAKINDEAKRLKFSRRVPKGTASTQLQEFITERINQLTADLVTGTRMSPRLQQRVSRLEDALRYLRDPEAFKKLYGGEILNTTLNTIKDNASEQFVNRTIENNNRKTPKADANKSNQYIDPDNKDAGVQTFDPSTVEPVIITVLQEQNKTNKNPRVADAIAVLKGKAGNLGMKRRGEAIKLLNQLQAAYLGPTPPSARNDVVGDDGLDDLGLGGDIDAPLSPPPGPPADPPADPAGDGDLTPPAELDTSPVVAADQNPLGFPSQEEFGSDEMTAAEQAVSDAEAALAFAERQLKNSPYNAKAERDLAFANALLELDKLKLSLAVAKDANKTNEVAKLEKEVEQATGKAVAIRMSQSLPLPVDTAAVDQAQENLDAANTRFNEASGLANVIDSTPERVSEILDSIDANNAKGSLDTDDLAELDADNTEVGDNTIAVVQAGGDLNAVEPDKRPAVVAEAKKKTAAPVNEAPITEAGIIDEVKSFSGRADSITEVTVIEGLIQTYNATQLKVMLETLNGEGAAKGLRSKYDRASAIVRSVNSILSPPAPDPTPAVETETETTPVEKTQSALDAALGLNTAAGRSASPTVKTETPKKKAEPKAKAKDETPTEPKSATDKKVKGQSNRFRGLTQRLVKQLGSIPGGIEEVRSVYLTATEKLRTRRAASLTQHEIGILQQVGEAVRKVYSGQIRDDNSKLKRDPSPTELNFYVLEAFETLDLNTKAREKYAKDKKSEDDAHAASSSLAPASTAVDPEVVNLQEDAPSTPAKPAVDEGGVPTRTLAFDLNPPHEISQNDINDLADANNAYNKKQAPDDSVAINAAVQILDSGVEIVEPLYGRYSVEQATALGQRLINRIEAGFPVDIAMVQMQEANNQSPKFQKVPIVNEETMAAMEQFVAQNPNDRVTPLIQAELIVLKCNGS